MKPSLERRLISQLETKFEICLPFETSRARLTLLVLVTLYLPMVTTKFFCPPKPSEGFSMRCRRVVDEDRSPADNGIIVVKAEKKS
jgi:hypothetical protein